MDTISRENNSMLPVGGIIVGAIGLLLGVFALVKASNVQKSVTDLQTKTEERVTAVESQAGSAAAAAQRAGSQVQELKNSVQGVFDATVIPALQNLQTSVTKLEEASKRPVAVAGGPKKSNEPAVAGPGEYIVKSGDNGMRIASANGVSIGDLRQVNPEVNWNSLKIGQKLKLPQKR